VSEAGKHENLAPALHYALAAAAIFAAYGVRQGLDQSYRISLPPDITLYPAIVFIAILGGRWVGIFATVLSTALTAVWILPPGGHLWIRSFSDILALALFFFLCVLICIVSDRARHYHRANAMLKNETELRELHATLDAALNSMTDAVFITDVNGKFLEFNQAFAVFHKFSSKEECAPNIDDLRPLVDVFYPNGDLAPLEARAVPRALSGETANNVEYKMQRKDTGETWIGSLGFSPVRSKEGNIIGTVVTARDITAQRKTEEALRASEDRYRTAFQTSLDAIAISRMSDGAFLDVNQAFLEEFGFSREEVLGKSALDLGMWVDPHQQQELLEKLQESAHCRDFELLFKKKGGQVCWGLVSASTIGINGESCVLTVIRDITKARLAEEEIRSLAFFDPLTGLANRRLLMERLSKSIVFSNRSHRKRALLFVDLDDFKTLNDTMGHQTGDLMLQEVALRLTHCVRAADTVGRLGGDEFVVLLEDLSESAQEAATDAQAIAEKILASVSQIYLLEAHECNITCSIGITVFGDKHEDIDEVFRQADIAMYGAKTAGRNTMRFFAPELQAAVSARATLEEELRQGIRLEQFVLYYQPQIDKVTIVGVEALLRWRHPTLGILAPEEFISLAELSRLILPLGNWVLESACRQIASWSKKEQTAGLIVAVNISALQLRMPDFVGTVLGALERTGANPHRLKLEFTETMLVYNVEEAIRKMNVLKSHGVQFTVDDFGTGYSSLAHLKRLPLDQFKIDGSFVRSLLDDSSSRVITQTILSLGETMTLSVIAEGVETAAQREFLLRLGCHTFQGYLFSHPLPAEEFEEWLTVFDRSANAVSQNN